MQRKDLRHQRNQSLVVFAVPRFVQVELLIERLLANNRQQVETANSSTAGRWRRDIPCRVPRQAGEEAKTSQSGPSLVPTDLLRSQQSVCSSGRPE